MIGRGAGDGVVLCDGCTGVCASVWACMLAPVVSRDRRVNGVPRRRQQHRTVCVGAISEDGASVGLRVSEDGC